MFRTKMRGPSVRLAPRLELRDEGAVRAHEFGDMPLGGASWFLRFLSASGLFATEFLHICRGTFFRLPDIWQSIDNTNWLTGSFQDYCIADGSRPPAPCAGKSEGSSNALGEERRVGPGAEVLGSCAKKVQRRPLRVARLKPQS